MRWPQRFLAPLAGVAIAASAAGGCGAPPDAPPLAPEHHIALAQAGGRIDHLALDSAGGRLFVAELGSGSVESIDVTKGRSLGRIDGLREPQGLGYLPGRDELVVATGGDGVLRFYGAGNLRLLAAVKLGADADDVRVDEATGRVVVGFGKALAVVDPGRRAVLRTIALPAHPEGFQIQGRRVFVNLPGAGEVASFDLSDGRQLARWRNPGASFNFPLALDTAGTLVAVVYRMPARLVLFTADTGRVVQQLATCGDADDAFFDAGRRRLYVICGAGAVDVVERGHDAWVRIARIRTRDGARTGLFAPKLDRLFVAERASGGREAAILVLRPN